MPVYSKKLWLLVRPKKEAGITKSPVCSGGKHAYISRHLGKLEVPHSTALHLSQHKCYQAKLWNSTVWSENQGRGANSKPLQCCATWGKEVWLKPVWRWFKLMLSVNTRETRILSLTKTGPSMPLKSMQCLPLLSALCCLMPVLERHWYLGHEIQAGRCLSCPPGP